MPVRTPLSLMRSSIMQSLLVSVLICLLSAHQVVIREIIATLQLISKETFLLTIARTLPLAVKINQRLHLRTSWLFLVSREAFLLSSRALASFLPSRTWPLSSIWLTRMYQFSSQHKTLLTLATSRWLLHSSSSTLCHPCRSPRKWLSSTRMSSR